MLKYTFLTEAFYRDFSHCPEIEKKTDRPYVRIQICVNGIWWAIPMRSNISHSHVLWTDQANGCGIDFSKAVVIAKPSEYFDSTRKPHIRPNEHEAIKRLNDHQIAQKLLLYISNYKKAKKNLRIRRNRDLISYSTLQYFEDYI